MKSIFAKSLKSFPKLKRMALPLAAIAVSAPLSAEVLKPMHGHRVQLGDRSAIVYYVPDGASYEVVTTVASSPLESDERMQFVTPVAPGQRSHVFVSGETAPSDTYILELEMIGGNLSVETFTRRSVAFRRDY